jgi:hypothetical protein
MNRKTRFSGYYRDAEGKQHTMRIDDENYKFIVIKGWPVTVWGDGSPVDPQVVQKEINETRLLTQWGYM